MQEALGMIETRGLVGAIEAADAMVKAANVHSDRQGAYRRRTGHRDGARRRGRGQGLCGGGRARRPSAWAS